MLALFFPLNLLDVDPDLPDWLFEVWVGGVIDFVSMAVFSFPHVDGLCPAIPQNVHAFFFQMHFPAWWFGSRQRVQTLDSLLSLLFLLLLPLPLFPPLLLLDLALFADPLFLFCPVFRVASYATIFSTMLSASRFGSSKSLPRRLTSSRRAAQLDAFSLWSSMQFPQSVLAADLPKTCASLHFWMYRSANSEFDM